MRVGMSYAMEDGGRFTMNTTSYPVYQALAALGSAFTSVSGVQPDSMAIGRGADLAQVAAVRATGQYFATLGIQPVIGRLFGLSFVEKKGIAAEGRR